jgi:hypothetical protein
MNYKKILEIAEQIQIDNTFKGDYPTMIYGLNRHHLELLDKELFNTINDNKDKEFIPQDIVVFNVDGIEFMFYDKNTHEISFNKK